MAFTALAPFSHSSDLHSHAPLVKNQTPFPSVSTLTGKSRPFPRFAPPAHRAPALTATLPVAPAHSVS